MPRRFSSAITLFVHVNGHQFLEYYFAVHDAREAANERKPPSLRVPTAAVGGRPPVTEADGQVIPMVPRQLPV